MKIGIRIYIIIGLLACSLFSTAQSDKDVAKVQAILHQQAKDWSAGDIDAFMASYWQSEQLQFIGSEGVTYGWQSTLDGYKRRYPDRAAMGQLRFEVLRVDKRSRKVITLIGKFHLKREIGDLDGIFLLVWKKIKGKWLIVADQTCA